MARGQRRSLEDWWDAFWAFVAPRSDGSWLFRGQGLLREQPLIPSIGRLSMGPYDPLQERQLFDEFRLRARQFEPGVGFGNWEWLALAQHFGVPTRLLDWSANPLVAAYFACCIQEAELDGHILALRSGPIPLINPATAADPFEIEGVHVVQVSALAARITSQRGAFTIQGDPTLRLNYLTKDKNRLRIPAIMKQSVMRQLFILGVDASHIMADMEGLGRTLSWRYKNRVAFQPGSL